MAKKENAVKQVSVGDKLKALYQLQEIDSKIDQIQTLRGELPLEVKDLEDEVAGLQTRIGKIQEEISEKNQDIQSKKNEIINTTALIKKYKNQQMNVRNNGKFESKPKKLKLQKLETDLCEKRIKEL